MLNGCIGVDCIISLACAFTDRTRAIVLATSVHVPKLETSCCLPILI